MPRLAPLLVALLALLSGCAATSLGAARDEVHRHGVHRDMGPGDTAVEPLRVLQTAHASFSVRASSGAARVCLLNSTYAQAWSAGGSESGAWACGSGSTTQETILRPGDYFLGLRCPSGGVERCVFDYDVDLSIVR